MQFILKNPAILVILIYLPQLILMFTSKRFSKNFNNTISNSKKDYLLEILTGLILAGILIYGYFSFLTNEKVYLVLGGGIYLFGIVLTYLGYFQFLFSEKYFVQEGVFRISRNPTYFFTSVAMMGICVLINSFILFLFVVLHFVFTHFIILKEEKYLERKFGKQYLNYKKMVARYLG
jgi:protein-S-isoprenylcysteine O-methyltransferase Ste14